MYWLPEAQRQASFQERFDEESLHRGQLIFAKPPDLPEDAPPAEFKELEKSIALGQGCANCHGSAGIPQEGQPPPDPATFAGGGFAEPCNVCPIDPQTNKPRVRYQAPPLQDVYQRWDEEIIRFTIERGRPGTPMPAWGVDYGGSMTDQQITDVMAWLASLPGNQNPPPALPDECSPEQPASPAPEDEQPEPLPENCGRAIFEARCAVCHGPQGQGKEAEPDESVPVEPGIPDAIWYQGMALWKGDVRHLPRGTDEDATGAFGSSHLATITNGRRFAFMPQFGEAPAQGIPVPPYPLTLQQIIAVMEYERTL